MVLKSIMAIISWFWAINVKFLILVASIIEKIPFVGARIAFLIRLLVDLEDNLPGRKVK